MNAEGMTVLAGSLAFVGSAKESKGFPSNGFKIMAATIALVIVYSIIGRGKLSRPIAGLAALTLLASVMYYVPVLFNIKTKKKKRKNNG